MNCFVRGIPHSVDVSHATGTTPKRFLAWKTPCIIEERALAVRFTRGTAQDGNTGENPTLTRDRVFIIKQPKKHGGNPAPISEVGQPPNYWEKRQSIIRASIKKRKHGIKYPWKHVHTRLFHGMRAVFLSQSIFRGDDTSRTKHTRCYPSGDVLPHEGEQKGHYSPKR